MLTIPAAGEFWIWRSDLLARSLHDRRRIRKTNSKRRPGANKGRHSWTCGPIIATVPISKSSIILPRNPRQNGAVVQTGGVQVEPFKRVRRLVAGPKAKDQELVETGSGLDQQTRFSFGCFLDGMPVP